MKKIDLIISQAQEELNDHFIKYLASTGKPTITNDILLSINQVVHQCTNKNIRICRNNLSKFLSTSDNTIFDSLLTYLTYLSKSIQSSQKKRLYLLYLIHDIIHELKTRPSDHREPPHSQYWSDQNRILALFAYAWEYPPNRQKLTELVEIWQDQKLFPSTALFNDDVSIQSALSNHNSSTSVSSLPRVSEYYLSQMRNNNPPLYTMPVSFSLSSHYHTGLLPSSSQIQEALKTFHEGLRSRKTHFKEADEDDSVEITSSISPETPSNWTYNGWTADFEAAYSVPIAHNQASLGDKLSSRHQMVSENGIPFNAFKPPEYYS